MDVYRKENVKQDQSNTEKATALKTREDEVSTLMKVSPISQAAKKGKTLPGVRNAIDLFANRCWCSQKFAK